MKKGKKLTLAKETVRDLEQRSLATPAGGTDPEFCTRNSSCGDSCWFTC